MDIISIQFPIVLHCYFDKLTCRYYFAMKKITCFLFSLYFIIQASAQLGVGSDKNGFQSAGKVFSSIGQYGTGKVFALAATADGKILAGGSASGTGSAEVFTLCRYMPDGRRDNAWGKNGVAQTETVNDPSSITALHIFPDGSILAAGNIEFQYANPRQQGLLTKYFADGRPDLNFGNGGKAQVIINEKGSLNGIRINAMEVQKDGKIIIAGSVAGSSSGIPYVLRCDAKGIIDKTFGNQGYYRLFNTGEFYSIVIQPDGKILVAGRTDAHSLMMTDVRRLLPTGKIDLSFGDKGLYTIKNEFFGHGNYCRTIKLLPDGKILGVGGKVKSLDYYSISDSLLVFRLTSKGKPDTSFNKKGIRQLSIKGSGIQVAAMSVLPNKKIVVSGTTTANNKRRMLVLQMTEDARPDKSFNEMGANISSVSADYEETCHAMLVLSGGQLITGGAFYLRYSLYHFCIASFKADGEVDKIAQQTPTLPQQTVPLPQNNSYKPKTALQYANAFADLIKRDGLGSDVRVAPGSSDNYGYKQFTSCPQFGYEVVVYFIVDQKYNLDVKRIASCVGDDMNFIEQSIDLTSTTDGFKVYGVRLPRPAQCNRQCTYTYTVKSNSSQNIETPMLYYYRKAQ